MSTISLFLEKDTGPGHYDISKVYSFGRTKILSTLPSPDLCLANGHATVASDIGTHMGEKSFVRKKAYKKGYRSDYEFPKKKEERLTIGRTLRSTVQFMPQFHKGKHSPGAYMRS